MDSATLIPIAAAAFLVGGTIKGLVGIGLPTAAIAFMTLFLDPRLAIALVLFPMLGSNLWQMVRGGYLIRTVKRYALFAGILFAGVSATAYGTQSASDRVMLAVLGVAVLIFVAASWRKIIPPLQEKYDKTAQVVFALISGVIGGMTAAWGPPMAMYLATKQVDKDEFVRATGFMISVGSIPLVVAYAQIGFMPAPIAGLSALMLIPTLIGFAVGEYFRSKLSGDGFRNAILILFLFLGLNLIRRAIWYS
ncbi:MAG: sulfite exporter TauE/SafE family protein [Roseobacter sp.]